MHVHYSVQLCCVFFIKSHRVKHLEFEKYDTHHKVQEYKQFKLCFIKNIIHSGGASYGAKGLKPPQFLLQPLQNFCVK